MRHIEITPEFQKLIDSTEWKTVPQGAATLVFVAASPLVEGITGRYFANCHEAEVSDDFERGVAPRAYDEESARRLWALSVAALRS